MIDIHNHVLPGLDDGAQTLEESLEMCRISLNDGVRIIVATPHTLNSVYENNRSTILAKVEELNAVIDREFLYMPSHSLQSGMPSATRRPMGIGADLDGPTNHVNLKIVCGADVHFCEEVLSLKYQDKITTVADGGKFLLLEFPPQGIPFQAETILFELMVRGVTPIITHPERNLEIARSPKRYSHMVERGCLGQITAASLTGGFGRDARETAEKLLRKNLVHFIASDAHSSNGRPPVLSSGVQAAAKIVGEEEAYKMVTEYPRAIIEGRRPDVPAPREGFR
jgi:protein-tyrosine phosphatase